MKKRLRPKVTNLTNPEAVRELRVRQLFHARHPEKPPGIAVLAFFGWLYAHNPGLLPKEKGDPYQHLKSDLVGYND